MDVYTYRAVVTRVVDGDTIDVDLDLGFKTHVFHRLRLAGINTPETYGVKKESQEYKDGIKAKERVEELVLGNQVFVKTSKDRTGKYGRYLAEVFLLSGDSLNQILLEEGLATKYP